MADITTQIGAASVEGVPTTLTDAKAPAENISLVRKTHRMGRLLHRYCEVTARTHGGVGDPSRGQGRVLALLKVKPLTSQRELGYLLDMRPQSLSELLAKLEDKGYVTRSKSEQDARVTMVALTETGAAAAPDLVSAPGADDPLDCLTGQDRANFEGYVDTIIASLQNKLEKLGVTPDHGPHGEREHRGGHGQGAGHVGHGRHGEPDHFQMQREDAPYEVHHDARHEGEGLHHHHGGHDHGRDVERW